MASSRDRWLRRRVLPSVSLAVAACAGSHDGNTGVAALDAHRRIVTATSEWEVREWRLELALGRERFEPLGFGSGGGLTALVQRTPRAAYQFTYYQPQLPMGGNVAREANGELLPLNAPSDVVGVTDDGITLYLDQSTGTVKATTISAQRSVVSVLDAHGQVQSACAIDDRTIAFIEPAHLDTVFLQNVQTKSTQIVQLSPESQHQPVEAWGSARLGGLLGTGCVLWRPEQPYVTLLGGPPPRRVPLLHETESWLSRMRRWLTRGLPMALVRDATTFPGGVAVLNGSGLFIDLYRHSGAYIESVTLPRSALRIAGSPGRLFVLSQSRDRIFLGSYVIP